MHGATPAMVRERSGGPREKRFLADECRLPLRINRYVLGQACFKAGSRMVTAYQLETWGSSTEILTPTYKGTITCMHRTHPEGHQASPTPTDLILGTSHKDLGFYE